MRGRVDGGGREAILLLTVIGSSRVRTEVEATVDTGFTGSVLPIRWPAVPLGVPVVIQGLLAYWWMLWQGAPLR